MRQFNHINAKSIEEASTALKKEGSVAMAGGGDLLGTMKDDIYKTYPKLVVNIKTIPGLDEIKVEGDSLRIGALAKLADIEESEIVNQYAPSIAKAASLCALPAMREMGTIGGNISQMPRCWYYRKLNNRFDCKRKGGDRCFALNGDNRYHSIFGGIRPGLNPCTAGCPAGTDIPSYIEELRKGNMEKAAEIIMQVNPLPSFTSRVCPHPCQNGCNQGNIGDPVNIHCIERSVSDYILDHSEKYYPAPEKETGKRIAVVGSGPAGLTVAYYLRKAGHAVTVFERQEKAGGVMRYGVPHYRLPKSIVDRVITAYEKMGIEFKTGMDIGKDISVETLDAEYDAVFLGTGAWKQPILGIGGEDLALFGLNFLKEVNTYLEKTIGRNVLVCGGGNVAMDVALTAKRLGAEKVTLICLEQREEMPASSEEIARAEAEGVEIHNGWGLGSVITDESGIVSGLSSMRCISVRDENGRFSPQYDKNDCVEYKSDFIILATGQAVDISFLGDKFLDQLKSARGLISVDANTYRTNCKGIYAAGDVSSGPNIAIRAIGGGRAAAMNISKDLGFEITKPSCKSVFVHFDKEGAKEQTMTPAPELPLEKRTLVDEDTLSYTAEQLQREIRRCMNCACYAVNQAELAPSLLALDASVETNERTIPVSEFFGVGVKSTTVLHKSEIITAVLVPITEKTVECYKRFSFRKSIDFPIINFAITADSSFNYKIWLGGVAPVPYRAVNAEEVLKGKKITPELAELAGLAAVQDADVFENNAYKVQLIKTLIKRELIGLL